MSNTEINVENDAIGVVSNEEKSDFDDVLMLSFLLKMSAADKMKERSSQSWTIPHAQTRRSPTTFTFMY